MTALADGKEFPADAQGNTINLGPSAASSSMNLGGGSSSSIGGGGGVGGRGSASSSSSVRSYASTAPLRSSTSLSASQLQQTSFSGADSLLFAPTSPSHMRRSATPVRMAWDTQSQPSSSSYHHQQRSATPSGTSSNQRASVDAWGRERGMDRAVERDLAELRRMFGV